MQVRVQENVAVGRGIAQNRLDTFLRNFPVDGEIANLLRTC